MPVIAKSSYSAPRFCANPHFQTVVPTLFRKVSGVTYCRERIDTPDGDFLDLDWSRVGSPNVIVVLHGLEGDSGRPYVMGMVKALNRRGWDAVALNFRGCSGEPNRKLRMYHSGETEDLNTVLSHVAASGRYAQTALVGWSLGGNVILKYLGERGQGIEPLVRSAVAISVPCDLKSCSIRMRELRNRLYLHGFLKMLRKKIQVKALMMPESVTDEGYEEIRTLEQFDDRYTARFHGFRDANDYYEKASSRQFLKNIAVPTLLINAADDPFLADSCFPQAEAAANPRLFLEIPRHGGHVGFMSFSRDGEYWSETRAASFLSEMLRGGN